MQPRAVLRLSGAFTRATKCESNITYWPFWSVTSLWRQRFPPATGPPNITRNASSSSSARWKTRQSRDTFAREAKVAGLKSRAAFKLLEINEKHRIFKRGDTVVDLGYAPGSWSQVAVNRTQPGGRVVGIDIIPAHPPRGVSTIQGDFLSPEIREEVRRFVLDSQRGRVRERGQLSRGEDGEDGEEGLTEEELEEEGRGLIERERKVGERDGEEKTQSDRGEKQGSSQQEVDIVEGRVVNVVLSDMSEPWPQTASTWIRSVSNPYYRMMNTSGMAFRDHAGSMVRTHILLLLLTGKSQC